MTETIAPKRRPPSVDLLKESLGELQVQPRGSAPLRRSSTTRSANAKAPAGPPVRPWVFAGMLLIAIFFGGFGAWAALAPLAAAAIAPGTVVVESKTKSIQHWEGGIIEELLVRQGDEVEAGQLLLRLAPIQAEARVDALRDQMLSARAAEARIRALLGGDDDLTFPDDLLEKRDNAQVGPILRTQEELFVKAREQLDGQIAIRDQKVEQLRAQSAGLDVQVQALRRQRSLLSDELDDLELLLEKELARQATVSERRRQLAAIDGQIGDLVARQQGIEQAIGEVRSESLKLRSEFEDKLTRELEQIQMVRTEANQKLRAAEDVLGRLEVRSPVTGKIVTMNYHTVGGVVAPAQPIMDIVPSGDHLRVEARIAPLDIDVVYPGLETDVRLTAFKSRTTPTIKGKLVDISGDLLEDRRTGQPYYLGVVEIDPDALAKLPNVTLKPGMPVDTIIKLKERTFLDYLIAPIEQSIVRSFRDGN